MVDELKVANGLLDRELDESKMRLAKAERGELPLPESRARVNYETGRYSALKFWALLMVRSLPAVPVAAALVAIVLHFLKNDFKEFPAMFLVCSAAGIAIFAISLLVGMFLQWNELGPRWIWFRAKNEREQRFDVVTSAGERIFAMATDFTLQRSPLLGLLGIGVVRRSGTNLKYVTTEPDAWTENLDKAQIRYSWVVDAITVVMLLAWVAALAVLAR